MPEIKILSQNAIGNLFDEKGVEHTPPSNWKFLKAGDAGITRKVTSNKEYWKVVFKKGRRTMSKGIWAPEWIIDKAKQEVNAQRNTEAYQKRKLYDADRREKQQQLYEKEFCNEVVQFLNFHPQYQEMAKAMAILVTKHAIPVGNGTVARTKQIPVNERAAKAVIAWMRHKTTAYDQLQIPLIKGKRREVRKELAQKSVEILNNYRKGHSLKSDCPLKNAISKSIKNWK